MWVGERIVRQDRWRPFWTPQPVSSFLLFSVFSLFNNFFFLALSIFFIKVQWPRRKGVLSHEFSLLSHSFISVAFRCDSSAIQDASFHLGGKMRKVNFISNFCQLRTEEIVLLNSSPSLWLFCFFFNLIIFFFFSSFYISFSLHLFFFLALIFFSPLNISAFFSFFPALNFSSFFSSPLLMFPFFYSGHKFSFFCSLLIFLLFFFISTLKISPFF